MKYDFDTAIDRKKTNSLKYDFAVRRGKPEDILPLWVADMDFPTAPEILEELHKAVSHGIFGYSEVQDEYFEVLHKWFLKRYDWEVQQKWLIKTPGVVYAIAAAVNEFTQEGDSVLIQQPVYYPFSETIIDNNRNLVVNSLVIKDGSYSIDFADFEKKVEEENVKLFVLCNPHNPVGRVWTKEELLRIGEICLKHNVLVVSDEIHADFIYPGHKHIVFANLSKELENITITCTSPSKTFNLAGLQVSNILISNQDIRRKFRNSVYKTGYSQLNSLGLVACQAAYQYGEEWLNQLKEYLVGNLNFIRIFLAENMPKVKLIEPEGTYLVWLDFREYGLNDQELEQIIVEKANLWLDGGTMFGVEGSGFQRINMACPRKILEQAMGQLEEAFSPYE